VVWAGLDNVALLNPPAEPVPGHRLRVLYSCGGGRALVRLDAVVTFDGGLTSTYPLGRWPCEPGGPPRVRALALGFPDWLVYRADGLIPPESRWVQSSVLVASLRRPGQAEDEGKEDGDLVVRDLAELQSVPPLRRPLKRHKVSPSWGSRMLRLTRNLSRSRCTEENGTQVN